MSAIRSRPLLGSVALAGLLALAGCGGPGRMDLDLRENFGNAFDTTSAVDRRVAARPQPDARGIITYPNYQVAVARSGDTVESIAARLGQSPDRLASYNGLPRQATLRPGELVALPGGGEVPSAPPQQGQRAESGLSDPAPIQTQSLEERATAAIDRSSEQQSAPAAPSGEDAPRRHRVSEGETAFSIARAYDVPLRSLAEWNGLGEDLTVREGQVLLIPTAAPPPENGDSQPGQGTVAPTPPSAARPLPEEEATQEPQETPASPELSQETTQSSASEGQLLLPVNGPVVRDFSPGANDGIDIQSTPGTPVRAAAAGTVAAITRDTDQIPILVLRHPGQLLTVYAGVANIAVETGDSVERGETIARIRDTDPAILHFEVREGFESVDPTEYLE